MHGRLVVAGAVVAFAASFPVPAQAEPPIGRPCALSYVTDHTREPGFRTGLLHGGPLVSTEQGVVHCRIQVNQGTHTGNGSDYEAICIVTPEGVICVYEPRLVSFAATAADVVVLCTRFVSDAGPTYYWTEGSTPGTGSWGTDPNAACSEPLTVDTSPTTCPVLLAADQRLGTNLAEIWQDCEPYEPII